MKKLYIIGGTMGVGKTTVCQRLKSVLPNSVFLDGDWCWSADPFRVTEETKQMVLQNIAFLLNQFIRCSAYENIIFCWVLHKQEILDEILGSVDSTDCDIKCISLVADEKNLRYRLQKDISKGIRKKDIEKRSIARIPCYENMNTQKIDTSCKSVGEICNGIILL